MADIKQFETQKVRTHWDEEKELWYFSIIDVIEILTDSNNPRRYWSDLKRKLEQEGFGQLYDIIVQLKPESRKTEEENENNFSNFKRSPCKSIIVKKMYNAEKI